MEQKTYTLNDGREINIKPLTKKDSELLSKFYSSLSENTLRWIQTPTRDQISERVRYPDYFINLIVNHKEDIVGYGEIQKDPEKLNGTLNIHIHQDYQGVGLGTAMIIMLLKEATEQKLHSVKLQVSSENLAAIHLFLKFGFQEQYTTKETYVGGTCDTLHMVKILQK